MKAFADFRMTMILERQDALRREAARARLVTHPTDGFVADLVADTAPAMHAGDASEAQWSDAPVIQPLAIAASGGNAKSGTADCGHSHGAAAA